MNTKEKLECFMRDRKKAVDTATLAAYFMVDTTTVNHNMRTLEDEGKVIRSKGSRGKNVWQWSPQVAVPSKPAPVRPRSEPAPIVGRRTPAAPSYPHVRGYDD